MTEALPDIVERFVREAKLGSIPHAKALAALSGMDKMDAVTRDRVKARRPRGPSLTEMLMQELKRGCETGGERPKEG